MIVQVCYKLPRYCAAQFHVLNEACNRAPDALAAILTVKNGSNKGRYGQSATTLPRLDIHTGVPCCFATLRASLAARRRATEASLRNSDLLMERVSVAGDGIVLAGTMVWRYAALSLEADVESAQNRLRLCGNCRSA